MLKKTDSVEQIMQSGDWPLPKKASSTVSLDRNRLSSGQTRIFGSLTNILD
jgi:hypothetical protein